MNISPIRAYGAQNFTRQFSRHDSDYYYPIDNTKSAKNTRTTQRPKAKKPKTDESEVKTIRIHWMDYGDGHRVPIPVED